MEKTIYVLIAVFVTALVFGAYQFGRDDLETSLYEGLDARVEKALGFTPSEDMRHLLRQPQPDPYFSPEGPFTENQYVVYLEGTQDVERIMGIFYEDMEYYCEIYLKSEDQWVYADFAEETKADHWMLLLSLMDYSEDGSTRPLPREEFEKINAAIGSYANRLKLTVKYAESLDETLKRTAVYDEMNRAYGETIHLVLQADEYAPFKGRAIHDAALALGLELSYAGYLWRVEEEGRPWSEHFTVNDGESDMAPETLAKNSYAAESLTFSFYLPYSVAPAEVFDNMVVAVEYFQKRLGGTIHDADGQVMTSETLAKMREKMLEKVKQMEELGCKPGTVRAYYLF